MYLDNITNDELAEVGTTFEKMSELGYRVYSLITDKMSGAGDKSTALIDFAKETAFMYKGDITDLSVFWTKQEIPFSDFSDLTPELTEKVTDNFNHYAKKGFLEINNDARTIKVTDKGKEFIYKDEFIKTVMRSNLEYNGKIIAGIEAEQLERTSDYTTLHNYEQLINYEADALISQEKIYDHQIEKLCEKLRTMNNTILKASDSKRVLEARSIISKTEDKLNAIRKSDGEKEYKAALSKLKSEFKELSDKLKPGEEQGIGIINYNDNIVSSQNEINDIIADKGIAQVSGTGKAVARTTETGAKAIATGGASLAIDIVKKVGYEATVKAAELTTDLKIKQ